MTVGHYEVLGVAHDADGSEVRRAYLRLAREHHPDRSGGDPDRMRAVNAAWAVLGDPMRRRQYDLDQALRRPAPEQPRAASVRADLDDDEPVRVTIALPRLVTMLPAGLFGAAIVSAIGGTVLRLPAVLGLALMFFVLSVLFLVAAPFLALYASRRPTGGGPEQPRR
jgi:curved DNA-binding protein CbpA